MLIFWGLDSLACNKEFATMACFIDPSKVYLPLIRACSWFYMPSNGDLSLGSGDVLSSSEKRDLTDTSIGLIREGLCDRIRFG